MAYDTHYCASVDILGFRNLIREFDAGNVSEDEMEDIFYRLQTANMIGAIERTTSI